MAAMGSIYNSDCLTFLTYSIFLYFLLRCLFHVHFPQILIQSFIGKRAEEVLLLRGFSSLGQVS